MADKAYDSKVFVDHISEQKSTLVISPKQNRKIRHYDKHK
ncbi:hypothetical protein P618_200996 [Holospora obtusa F1]|uniref:Uncharacterized protein n=1 Tax=Holospora obtusa F1 TaxID=1399147 RepID=W6TG82_HOLOB|nr:hypothetical protein P618_200996 [Holospora obtusa F1]